MYVSNLSEVEIIRSWSLHIKLTGDLLVKELKWEGDFAIMEEDKGNGFQAVIFLR